MILIALLFGLQRRIFSGFRSEWMTDRLGEERKRRAVSSWVANLRVRVRETPWNWVFFSSSYRLQDSSSNTRQRWLRNTKCRFNVTANTHKQYSSLQAERKKKQNLRKITKVSAAIFLANFCVGIIELLHKSALDFSFK